VSEAATTREPAAASAAETIRVRGLRKAFRGHLGIGRTVAVDGIDFTVERGEVFGLLGPNGAGKTTTLKMLLGLLRPDAGEVRLFGLPPSEPAARARLGFLPENPYFYDYLSAEEFLDFYGRLHGVPADRRRERVAAALRRVGLAERSKVALRKFSKGMTQRLGLAQAIQHDPELVILDEPMSGLDPIGRREVRDLILELKSQGKTVFFSSHILQDAEMICDRVAILKAGRLRSVGRLHEMVNRTVRWFEVSIRGPVPESGNFERVSSGRGESLVRVTGVDSLERLLAACRESGGQVTSVWPRRDTLEDLFLREIGAEPARTEPRP
jgi:ABC-2 type transport system ATP-binding protein